MENTTNSGYDSSQPKNQSSFNTGAFDSMNAKLPADPTSMVLAIIATCLTVLCCCFGGYYLGLILSIIGYVLAVSSLKKYYAAPHEYRPDSFQKVTNAKTFNLVVLIVTAILAVLGILSLVLRFSFLDKNLMDDIFENQGIEVYQDDDIDTDSEDVYETTDDDWEYIEEEETIEELDSVQTDVEIDDVIIEDVNE